MMQTYAEYKNSGVDWLGEIPAEWDVRRLKFLCSIGTGERNTEDKIDGGKYPFYVRSQKAERIGSYSFDGEAILTAGDGAGVGKVYHYVDGKFDFHQRVYKFSNFKSISGKYLFHYISNTFYSVAVLGTAKTTVDSLRLPLIQDFWISFPPLPEQTAIADFLDNKTAKIDELVGIKRRQIALLGERKQILIQNAVTKGLNAQAPMKDSEVDWIGKIPAHWYLTNLKRIVDVRDGTHDTPEYVNLEDGTHYLITSKDFLNSSISFENAKSISRSDHLEISKRSGLETGDVLMSMIGGNIGKSVIVGEFSDFSVKNVAIFRTLGNMNLADFIQFYLGSGLLEIQVELNSTGGAQDFLSLGNVRNLYLPKMPETEVKLIVSYLKKCCNKIDTAIAIKQNQITKLNEYKTTLINAAVTGKIKVV